jgi:hypothetical protein
MPNYVSQFHSQWLGGVKVNVNADGTPTNQDTVATNIADAIADTFNLAKVLEAAAALNPFTGVASFDPSTVIADINTQCDEFLELVADLDPEEQIAAAILLGTEQADTVVNDDSHVDAAVRAFERRTQGTFQRAASRSYASLLGSRSVMTGMWDNTVAFLENQRQAEVSEYDARIRSATFDQRVQTALQTSQQLISLMQTKLNAAGMATELQMKVGAMHVAMKNDQITQDVAFDKNEVLWKADMFPGYVAGMVSAFSGGVPSARPQSMGEKIMATMFGAASFGVSLFSILK